MEDRGITDRDCAWVLEHDDLCSELICYCRGLVGGTTDISAADVALCNTADVKSDVITGDCLGDFLVVHLDGLDFSILVCRHEGNLHAFLHNPGLDTANRYVPIPLML